MFDSCLPIGIPHQRNLGGTAGEGRVKKVIGPLLVEDVIILDKILNDGG
jgi:hypothetical protein